MPPKNAPKKTGGDESKRKGKKVATSPKKKQIVAPPNPDREAARARGLLVIGPNPTAPRLEIPRFPRPQEPVPPVEVPYPDRFVNDHARFSFEGPLRHKPMIVEKGVDDTTREKNFMESLRKRGRHHLMTLPPYTVNLTLVREFYANFIESDLARGVVRGRGSMSL